MSELPTKYEGGQIQTAVWEQPDKLDLIKRTVARGATDDELKLFLYQAARTGLDPLSRQIHFVKRNTGGTIQTGIDGYRLIADRTRLYAGSDDYRFDEGLSEYEHIQTKRGNPTTATVTVWKIVGGQRAPFTATTRWEEYYPGDKQGFMWKKMPYLMLGKTAEALALRKAFPAELSGLYTNEEMEQAGQADYEVVTEQPAPKAAPMQGDLADELYKGQPPANGRYRQADRPTVQKEAGEDYAKMTGQLKAWLESRLPEQIEDALQTAEEKVSKWPPENQGAGRAVIESARFEYDGRMNMLSQMREAMLVEDRKGDAADFDVLGKEWQAKMREWPRAWQEHAVVVWNGVLDELEGMVEVVKDPVAEVTKAPAIKKTKQSSK